MISQLGACDIEIVINGTQHIIERAAGGAGFIILIAGGTREIAGVVTFQIVANGAARHAVYASRVACAYLSSQTTVGEHDHSGIMPGAIFAQALAGPTAGLTSAAGWVVCTREAIKQLILPVVPPGIVICCPSGATGRVHQRGELERGELAVGPC